MSIQNSLERFSKAKAEITEHIAQNEGVFKAHERLVGNLIDAENALRDDAAADPAVEATLQPVVVATNGQFSVTVTPQFQEYVNVDELKIEARGNDTLLRLIKTVKRSPRINISERKG